MNRRRKTGKGNNYFFKLETKESAETNGMVRYVFENFLKKGKDRENVVGHCLSVKDIYEEIH